MCPRDSGSLPRHIDPWATEIWRMKGCTVQDSWSPHQHPESDSWASALAPVTNLRSVTCPGPRNHVGPDRGSFFVSELPIIKSSQWNSPGKNTRVGSHSLLQGIFPTQGSNPGLLHCRQILYHLSRQQSPKIFLNETFPNAPKNKGLGVVNTWLFSGM